MSANRHECKLATIQIDPPKSADAVVIWLHGLGATGDDFVPIIDQLGLGKDHSVRFIFPHAPTRAITVNGGAMMPGWFDIESLEINQQEDVAGIEEASEWIVELLKSQLAEDIDSKRILLAGFSQGGALALYTGLRFAKPLAGLIGLSTYLSQGHRLAQERTEVNQALPVFLCHGLFDPIVTYQLGKYASERLNQLGNPVTWFSYPMQHTVIAEEIIEIGRFIKQVLGME